MKSLVNVQMDFEAFYYRATKYNILKSNSIFESPHTKNISGKTLPSYYIIDFFIISVSSETSPYSTIPKILINKKERN
jgi:hypothetical protein